MKFLILRFSSIGDIVLTTPVIRCLRLQMPEAEIHFLSRQNFRDVLEHNPYINKNIFFKDDVDEVISELKKEKYDYIIDLHHNIRSLRVKRALKTKSFSFNKLNIEKWLIVNLKINRLPKQHIVDRYLETISSFGIKNDGQGLDYFISAKEEKAIEKLPEAFGKNFIAWAIGAHHATKQLPIEKMISIARKIKLPVVILGGKEDINKSNELIKHFQSPVFNGCGIFSINESAAIIKHAQHVLTHDTGMMHIAAAFRKNIISVWGNTIPEFGMSPYLPAAFATNSLIVQVNNLSCRPCSKIGYQKCPKGHFKCMKEINENEIIKHLHCP